MQLPPPLQPPHLLKAQLHKVGASMLTLIPFVPPLEGEGGHDNGRLG